VDVGKRKINEVFTNNRTLEIPFFQRSYVWSDKNWSRFIDDVRYVSDNKREHFMGSLILKQRCTPSNCTGDYRNIVDGQQRLTTLLLMFKVICNIKDIGEFFDFNFRNLLNKEGNNLKILHNHNDIEIFEAILDGNLSDDLTNKYKSNNILLCYNYFLTKKDVLREIKEDVILNNLYFVVIDLFETEDEQQIFDTINSLGVSLTTAELLKNELFKRKDEELYGKTWKEAFEGDEDIRSFWDMELTSGRLYRVNIDLLLQSYLLIKSGAKEKYIGLDSLFYNYKEYMRDYRIYESKETKDEFIYDLVNYANLYRKNINKNIIFSDVDKNSRLDRLNLIIFSLGITTIVPYILYVVKNIDDDDEKNGIFMHLESFLMRRLICKETNKDYNNLFAKLIRKEVLSLDALKKELFNFGDIANKFPDNDELYKAFFENNLTNQQARLVLYIMELSVRNDKLHSTSLLPINSYSLEHMMPKKWRNNWGDNLNELQANERDRLLLKLGNLMIITCSLNSSIRDSSWNIKLEGNLKHGGLKKFAAGLDISDECLSYEEWNESRINDRILELYELSKEIWQV